MSFYKLIDNGYVIAIGSGGMGVEITEDEYNEIKAAIASKPSRTDTTDYRLREDLTWEEYELEPQPYEPTETDKAQAYDILTGVSE